MNGFHPVARVWDIPFRTWFLREMRDWETVQSVTMFAIGHRLCTAMCDTPTKKPLLWKRFGRWCRENPKQHFHQYRLFWSQDCLLFKIHPVRSIAYIGFAHGLIRFNLLKAPSIHVHTVGNVYVHQVLKNNSTKTNKHPAIPTLPRPSNLGN